MEETMEFIQLSDLHLDDPDTIRLGVDTRHQFERLIQSISHKKIKELIFTGDIAEATAIDYFFKRLSQHGFQLENIHMVYGNHDSPELFSQYITRPLYYDKPLNDCHLLFIDTHNGYVDEIQLEWIKQVLSFATKPIVAFSHYPILDCGNTFMDRKYPLKNREVLCDLFEKCHQPVHLFCGHYHTTHVQSGNHVMQYICPSGFVQIKQQADDYEIESKAVGYRMVKLVNHQVITEVIMIE